MIDAPRLLKDLQSLLRDLEEDLRERVEDVPELNAKLRAEHVASVEGGRTGQAYEQWREESLTQAAVAWILGCVFVRFMEDNGLISTPRLSGPGERRQRALDQHELYFKHPDRRTHSDRDYLLHVFAETQKLPAAREVFDEKHNPLWSIGLSGDGATHLLEFWQRVDPETGELGFDFTDPEWNTRFLGDLYQDLSESARKKYALLQTPEFVEEFILDRTLTPAINEFGFQEVRMIDPTCGSGHFLLGAFHRLFDLWVKHEPGTNPRELAQRALGQVYGVDLNPFAVAIARFRLLVAALKVCEVTRLADAPRFELNLAAGDSLLHGRQFCKFEPGTQRTLDPEEDPLRHVFETEDAEALGRILGQQYHAVVGNPPYPTVKDKVLNQAYRGLYKSCHRQYSLVVPFMERFFNLALSPASAASAGFVGLIVANSFMKREFGKKLIEEVLPRLDLTHVIDTSGAYIPGHGTPTVILFGRNQVPVSGSLRAVQGIRGEPTTPENPARGLVWTAVLDQIDRSDSESEWVGVTDLPRGGLDVHPWSLGGGGATDLKSLIGEHSAKRLGQVVADIGRTTHTGEDNVFYLGYAAAVTSQLIPHCVPLVEGESVRDYSILPCIMCVLPYDQTSGDPIDSLPVAMQRHFWRFRSTLRARRDFGQTPEERGLRWFDHSMFFKNRYRTPLSIAFASVATHNHFVLDRGGKVFKQSAPIIILPPGATEEQHLELLGLLNCSTACFWMKQVFHNKGSTVDDKGARQTTRAFENFYDYTGTGLNSFPLPNDRPGELAERLDKLAEVLDRTSPQSWRSKTPENLRDVEAVRLETEHMRRRMISLQEELDWKCYHLYGLTDEPVGFEGDPPPLDLGQRAFEIDLARRMEAGEIETTWFERHNSSPITEIPDSFPNEYRELVARRIRLIRQDRNIGLIERPEYKRRWNTEPWDSQLSKALIHWMQMWLERLDLWNAHELATVGRLADIAARDPDFMRVAACYRDNADFDVTTLVHELVDVSAVPSLAVLRFRPSGLRKHAQWKKTWDLQRREDGGDLSPSEAKKIPVPPKYTTADFQSPTIWHLRGKLDVPKERFISFLHCERDADPSLVIGWAGWNHLEQAQAIAAYYLKMKEREGWTPERLTPLLTALLELVPWVKQWHNDIDAEMGTRMGDYMDDFVHTEARELELTLEGIAEWKPPTRQRRRKRSKKT